MAEMTDVVCEDCGAIFPMIVGSAQRRDQNAWYPGRKCPICGSPKFLPVVKTAEGMEKPLAKWKVDRRVGIAAAIVAGVFLIIGFVWYLHERPRRPAGEKALYVCDVCKERFLASVSGKVPKKCPACKGRTAYRALQCLNCYEVYPGKSKDWAKNPPTCPKCQSTLSQILPDFSDIREKPPKKPDAQDKGTEGDEEQQGLHVD